MLNFATTAGWLLLMAWLPCFSSPALPPPSAHEVGTVPLGKEYSIHSSILNEDRRFFIYLPKSYEAKGGFALKAYPVLYVLDGDSYFFTASSIVNFMSEGGVSNQYQIPEHIVVGVAQKDRETELTPTEDKTWGPSGHGGLFLRFLNEELVPRIEAEYRTIPFKTLVGHSLGGLLTCCSLLDANSRFNAYLAIDPSLWWDDGLLLKQAKTLPARHLTVPRTVYFALSHNPHESHQLVRNFFHWLVGNPALGYRSGSKEFNRETHGSVPLVAMYEGLKFIFDGYEPSPEDVARSLKFPAYVNAHFREFSTKMGTRFLPSEERIDQYAEKLAPEEALEWYRLNADNYPDSAHAQFALGKAYAARGEKQLAVRALERSLERNPGQPEAEEILRKCRQ